MVITLLMSEMAGTCKRHSEAEAVGPWLVILSGAKKLNAGMLHFVQHDRASKSTTNRDFLS